MPSPLPASGPRRRARLLVAAIATSACLVSPSLITPALADDTVPVAPVTSDAAPATPLVEPAQDSEPTVTPEGTDLADPADPADPALTTPDLATPATGSAAPAAASPGAFEAPVPTITGTPRIDTRLTAAAGTWNGNPTLTYQWKANGTSISGATSSAFSPSATEVGKKITVSVTGAAAGFTTTTVTSAPTTAVSAGTFTAAPAPTITGSAVVGSKLTAVSGTWAPKASFSYQWKANGKSITGATGKTYSLAAADLGKTITVTVTATRAGYTTRTKTSAATAAVAAGTFATAPTPTISGTAKVGSTLTATAGTWSPSANIAYQWKSNGTAIKGATRSTYVVQAADHTKKITVTTTGSRTGWTSKTRTSSATSAVVTTFAAAPAPKITGTVKVGSLLKATTTGWSPTPTFTYQWLRGGTAIAGATTASYTLTSADYGKLISVKVVGKKTHYVAKSRTSASTVAVAKPSPVLTTDGQFRVGTDIKAGTYIANPSASGCYWERRNAPGNTFEGILANDFTTGGPVIVTILSSDKYFDTRRCGSWAPLLTLGSAKTTFGEGTFVVGSQIKKGTYRAPGGKACYWEGVSNFQGGFNPIIDNDFSEYEQQYVDVSSFKGFTSRGCGTWTRVS